MQGSFGRLVPVRSASGAPERTFDLSHPTIAIGRAAVHDIVVPDARAR